MIAGGFGLGSSLFHKAHRKPVITCHRTTSYSHSGAVEMSAVTERTFYLNPRIAPAMGTADERSAYGLTESQLQAWCRVANTSEQCASKYRHYGCEWDGACNLRPTPICSQWHVDYPNPNSTTDLEQCQPLDGFSPCALHLRPCFKSKLTVAQALSFSRFTPRIARARTKCCQFRGPTSI